MPLATELMPSVTDSFREMVQVIQDNKETITDAVKGWGSALKTVAELLVFIGDQLFTDLWGAKRSGMRNILVHPIDPHEEIQIILKRIPERVVLSSYLRKNS